MIGVVNLDKLNQANEPLAWIYFFVFYLIFNLLVLLLFIVHLILLHASWILKVIIISTYVQLRKKLQLTTLALAELAAEKSHKLKEKYMIDFIQATSWRRQSWWWERKKKEYEDRCYNVFSV